MQFRTFFLATCFVTLSLVSSLPLPSGPGKSVVLLQLGSKKTENQGPRSKSSKDASSDAAKGGETKPGILSAISNSAATYAIGATAATYYLNNMLSMGAIPASSLIGMLAAMLFSDKMAIAAFCGSFAGMAKTTVIPHVASSFVLGICCAVVLALFDKLEWLVGVGGRLGFIAQCACTYQFIVASLLGIQSEGAALYGAFPEPKKLIQQFPSVAFFTVAGALFMSYWKVLFAKEAKETSSESSKAFYQKMSTSVAASSATGLLASAALPASLAGPAFCGSFIAMSSPTRLVTYGSLVGASVMGGVVQLLLTGTLLGGWGGKLGTSALLGVLMYSFLVRTLSTTSAPEKSAAAIAR